jgi:cell division protein FtsW (lipid II flippase)
MWRGPLARLLALPTEGRCRSMLRYSTQVSWVLVAAFALSLLYELYRSTAKAGISRYDSIRGFLTQQLPFYVIAFVLAMLVRTGWRWVVWTALAAGVALIMISVFYYSPTILPQRKPSPIDWFEDKLYTGLLFVAVALLAYDLLGKTLVP